MEFFNSLLSDEQRELIEPLLPGKVGDRGRSGVDNRKFVEAVLWIANTGAAWRDLPASFGNWNSNFRRFRRWAIKGVFDVLFERQSGLPGFKYAMIDGKIVRVHQQGARARGDSSLGDRTFARRTYDEDRRAGRSAGKSCSRSELPHHDQSCRHQNRPS
jgi:transposase